MANFKLNSVLVATESGGTVTLDSAVTGNTAITGLGTVTAGTLGAGSILNGTRLTDLKSTDGGESAITCDASGYVTFPQQPSFLVKHTTDGQIADCNGVIPFNDVFWQNGISYSTSTHKATVPVTGLYYFRAFTITKDDVQHAMSMRSTQGTHTYTHSYGPTWNRIAVDLLWEGTASQEVWPELDLSGSSSYWHGGMYSAFYGYLIG